MDVRFTFCLHGREKAKEQFATPILLLDDWMTVRWRCDPRLLRVARPLCNRIGVVFASTSTHARTYTRVTSIEAWSTNYYVSLVSTDLFFFPRTLFFLSYTPMDRTVYGSHMAVDNAPTFVYVHVETAFIEVVESFPMLLQPDDMALNNTTVFNLAFSCLYLFFFLPSLPSSLPFFFPRKTNSVFDYICSGYVVTRYNHLTARSKPFLRGI